MRKTLAVTLFICTASLGPVAAARANTAASFDAAAAQDQQDPQYQDSSSGALFSADQLDNLLAPIALYPDPLLAQVLPASTFVDQIDEASRWLRANNDPNGIDNAPWDVSVKAVAHYPTVLYMMADKIDWTTSLGQAYVNQSTDVMSSIQRLRALAQNAGNLVSNQQQQVIQDGNYIRIDPYQPQYIYVPVYDPVIAYSSAGYGYGRGLGSGNVISFAAGFLIGAWLNNDVDWGHQRVYYHGWQGGGWVGRSRPDVRISNTYVNNNYTNVQVNQTVINNTVNYGNLNRYNTVHKNVNYNNVAQNSRVNRANVGIQPNRGNVVAPVSQANPGNRWNQSNPVIPNKIIQRNVNTADPRINANRGWQGTQPQPTQQQNRGVPPSQTTLSRPAAPLAVQPTSFPISHQAPLNTSQAAQNSRVTRQPVWQAPPQNTPQPQPAARPVFQQPARPVAQPARAVFGGNQSGFDPRAASQRGQASRAVASQSWNAPPSQSNTTNQPAASSPRNQPRPAAQNTNQARPKTRP